MNVKLIHKSHLNNHIKVSPPFEIKIKEAQFYFYYYSRFFLTFAFGYSYLSKDKLFLIVDRIESVCWHYFCTHLFPDGVCGQSIHVYFHIGTHFLIRQKLSRYNLQHTLRLYALCSPLHVLIIVKIKKIHFIQ